MDSKLEVLLALRSCAQSAHISVRGLHELPNSILDEAQNHIMTMSSIATAPYGQENYVYDNIHMSGSSLCHKS
jgi:hypothetical protein